MGKTNSTDAPSNFAFPFGSSEASISDAFDRNRAAVENTLHMLNSETLRFVGKRFEHTGQAIEECQDCKTFPELMAAQQKWVTDAVREYVEEGFRFGETMQKMLTGFVELQAPSSHKESMPKASTKETVMEVPRVRA